MAQHTDADLARDERETGATAYCQLFADLVTGHLCELRRKELNAQGAFSCEGCRASELLLKVSPAAGRTSA